MEKQVIGFQIFNAGRENNCYYSHLVVTLCHSVLDLVCLLPQKLLCLMKREQHTVRIVTDIWPEFLCSLWVDLSRLDICLVNDSVGTISRFKNCSKEQAF